MGNCIYCQRPAGFFKKFHNECEMKWNKGKEEILNKIVACIKDNGPFDVLRQDIHFISKDSYVSEIDVKRLLVSGWESALDEFLEDGVLDEEEENRIDLFQNFFQLTQEELDIRGGLTRAAKSAVIRELLEGNIPQRVEINGQLPINFLKNEQIVWVFRDSMLLEDKTRRKYVGSSQGISIRLMKGVYYRAGSFKGQPVEYSERIHVDTGWAVATNKNFYFAGQNKSLRIPYEKILTYEPFSDGIGIVKDGSNAKLQVFVTHDGWFTYNLVTNLSRLNCG